MYDKGIQSKFVSPGREGDVDVSLSDWTLESWLVTKGRVLTEKEALTATGLVPRNMLNFVVSNT